MKRSNHFKLILLSFFLSLFLFFVYSYTQLDLNLTLSSNAIYQHIQIQLTSLGYFNRQASATVYLFLLLFISIAFWTGFLYVKKGFISKKEVVALIAVASMFGFLSYPAFSHDFFNYMFDSRIITKYGQNPYFHKALDYPDDLWTRFMRWTHRTYPYGPLWLILTVPFSFFGFGKFLPTLFLYKAMFVAFYIGNCILIYKILQILKPKQKLAGLYVFALNPLVIIESLISPHNESIMLFFLLLSIYEIVKNKNLARSIVYLIISAGIKFVTFICLPVIFIYKKKVKANLDFFLLGIFWALALGVLFEVFYREAYPWYFLMLSGICALFPEKKHYLHITLLLGLGTILRYSPFLYTGEYSLWVQNTKNILTLLPLIIIYPASLIYSKLIQIKKV